MINKKKEKIKVVSYMMIETEKDKEIQEKLLEIMMEAHREFELKNVYCDEETTEKRKERTNLLKMIKEAQEQKFDLVIVSQMSKFSMNVFDAIEYVREIRKYGVEIIFVIDGIDSRTKKGQRMLSLRNLF